MTFTFICALSAPLNAIACSGVSSSSAAADRVQGEARSKLEQLRNRNAVAKGGARSLPTTVAEGAKTAAGTAADVVVGVITTDGSPDVVKHAVETSGQGAMKSFAAAGERAATGAAGAVSRIGGVIVDGAKGLLDTDVAVGVREIYKGIKEKDANRGAGMPMHNSDRNQLEQAMK